jgi:thioredoxin reductase (NADPH)
MVDDHLPKQDQITIYSTPWCSDCHRARRFFDEHGIRYVSINIDQNPQARAYVEQVNGGNRSVPTIVFRDGSILVEPSNAELAAKFGLNNRASLDSYDVVVVGGGPAGMTASMYLAREGLSTLVVEKAAIGGQIGLTTRMENFPGFPEGISGVEFAERMERQVSRFGVELLKAQDVVALERQGQGWKLRTAMGGEYRARAVLIATGARYRRLDVPGEERLVGSSVHFCAACDAPFYRDKKVLVVGGGNSGFDGALFLSRFARQVDLIEFLPEVKASHVLQQQAAATPNLSVTTNRAVRSLRGNGRLEGVEIEDRLAGQVSVQAYDGVFVFIGLEPNTALLRGKTSLDPNGFILTGPDQMTDMPGVFAAGDVRAGSTHQAAAAVGEGATVALRIRDYLKSLST